MIDLTGGNLTAYLLREVFEVMGKHPRFRRATVGQSAVSFIQNNAITLGNVSCLVKNISTQGTRLSPDYFCYIQMGYTILAKVGDHDGAFVEWVQDIEPKAAIPGVYYITVDKVVEKTLEVELAVQKFLWYQGGVKNVQGQLVYLAPQFNPKTVIVSDANTGYVLVPYVDYTPWLNYLIMIRQVDVLQITTADSPPVQLQGGTDFWIKLETSVQIATNTAFGAADVNVPGEFEPFPVITDQLGYVLINGKDYTITGVNAEQNVNIITLSSSSPAGTTLTASGIMRLDPNSEAAFKAENILPTTLPANQKLSSGKAITSQGNFTYDKLIVRPDGSVTLPIVLQAGGWYKYDLRVSTPVVEGIKALKQNLNRLQKVTHDQSGQELTRTDVIPGVWLAIGDNVTEQDQVAILVSPTRTECYEVYGSKENLTFTLDVKANDLMTASELSELIKAEWTYKNRDNMEADGITIFDISREQTGEARDASGTATTYTYSLNVTASCDWKGFVPLVNRVTHIDVVPTTTLSYPTRLQVLGAAQFVPDDV